ncbi:hypothetical protein ABH931_004708 [Streptacidiphilus sp. MAP12-33]|uniref:hypothetical protein n=1 Tax=Streptacidiphilus sp. MAP12-33 TaxID=3156266 RepID=UPI003513786E
MNPHHAFPHHPDTAPETAPGTAAPTETETEALSLTPDEAPEADVQRLCRR